MFHQNNQKEKFPIKKNPQRRGFFEHKQPLTKLICLFERRVTLVLKLKEQKATALPRSLRCGDAVNPVTLQQMEVQKELHDLMNIEKDFLVLGICTLHVWEHTEMCHR